MSYYWVFWQTAGERRLWLHMPDCLIRLFEASGWTIIKKVESTEGN